MTGLECLQAQMTEWRRDLHRHPEFGFEESRTAAFVAETLRGFGIEVVAGIGGTGVVGTLKRGTSNRAIAMRADMDALRITEATGTEWASTTPGTMHACGHDGHTAMLLGAARLLAEEGGFDGTVRFLFQPAEEWGQGALAMLDVDPQGFDVMDRKLLEALIHRFDGGPVGLDNIAASIGEEAGTIEDVIEPYLIQQGYLQRTTRGRVATLAAYRHLGVTPPQAAGGLFDAGVQP